MWGTLVVGIVAVHAGTLDGVLLALIALVPLAAFELVTDLPTATQTLQRVRRSATRTLEVIDTRPAGHRARRSAADSVGSPGCPRVRGLRARYGDPGPWVLDGLDLELCPVRPSPWLAAAAPASRRSPTCCCASCPTRPGRSP